MTLSGIGNNPSPTIMFVDDDLHLREALKRCLRSEPFNILLASSGEEALDILDVHRDTVDVVVSDENMPGGMSGTDLFVRMRIEYPHIIRIMLTGHVNSRVAISAINEGRIFKFIPKPVDSAELVFSIRYALTQQQAQRDLERSEERFRMLSEATFEGVALTADGVIEDMNRQFADMFGYTPSELAGMELAGLAAPEFRDAVISHIRSNCVESCEFIGVKKGGARFPLEARHKALARGGKTLHLTVIRDLTERKRAEEALINVKPFSTAMLTEKIITALRRQDRRAMPRADARGRKIDVRMTFGAAHSYSGSLVNISQTGLLVRAPLFRHGVKGVYEPADLSLQCGDGTLDLPAEIAKMERDSAEFCSLRYMMVGFQFTCLDVANGRKLRSFIEQLGGGAPEPCWGGALNCSLDNDG